jgi:hypothetical protein
MVIHDVASGNGRDLWGRDFGETPVESAPVALLKEQADALTRRTGGRIVGEVSQEVEKGTVWASLYARAPSLQDYQHKLVSIAHPVVTADPERPFPLTVMDTQSGDQDQVEDMVSFEGWLAGVLSSDAVHDVVDSLLRYSRGRAAS